ncbi:putative ABC transport system substrate-binding protein [Bradyrhizobium sp. USDA 4472]
MRRREFIAGTAATAAISLADSCTETNAGSAVSKRIAIVHPSETPEGLTLSGRRAYKAYFRELNRLGYFEGQNLKVERYSALGRLEHYESVARAAVESQPDLIVCIGSPLALRLRPLTSTIPIVATTADPVAAGLVSSLARPGANVTGVTVDAGIEVWGKRLQLLGEVARPPITSARFLFTSPANSANLWQAIAPHVREAAQAAGTSVAAAFLGKSVDQVAYEQVFDAMERGGVDGLVIFDAAEHLTNRQLIANLAIQHRLPTIYPFRDFVEVGGLLSYGIDTVDMMQRLADMTADVLNGKKPEEIPLYQQTKFELVLNRAAARSLGIDFPTTVLAVADELIE